MSAEVSFQDAVRYGAVLKLIMQTFCPHLKGDRELYEKIRSFRLRFMTKNADHMAFFGGNLTGVYVVRFTPEDRDTYFTEVLGIDEMEIADALTEVPIIKDNWKTSKDPFNQIAPWLIHLFLTSKTLDKKTREDAAKEVAIILSYRFLTGCLYQSFRYPCDRQLAEAAYANLSNKFLLKQLGTWQSTLDDRAAKLIDDRSIHRKALESYSSDKSILYVISDSSNRIRDIMKNIYRATIDAKEKGSKIKSGSNLVEFEGDLLLKDKSKSLHTYTQYLHQVVTDENSFVKDELLDIMEKVVHTAPKRQVENTLRWMSQNYAHVKSGQITGLIDKTMLHSFSYLENNRNVYSASTDLTVLMGRLKGIYTSSRSTDPDLLEIRKLCEDIVKIATGSKNNNLVVSIRTAVLLYMVLRAFTMHHYSRL